MSGGGSDVQIADVQSVILDELPTRLDFITHQSGKHVFRRRDIGSTGDIPVEGMVWSDMEAGPTQGT